MVGIAPALVFAFRALLAWAAVATAFAASTIASTAITTGSTVATAFAASTAATAAFTTGTTVAALGLFARRAGVFKLFTGFLVHNAH